MFYILVWDVNLACDYNSRLNLDVTGFVAVDVAFHIICFRKVRKAIFRFVWFCFCFT